MISRFLDSVFCYLLRIWPYLHKGEIPSAAAAAAYMRLRGHATSGFEIPSCTNFPPCSLAVGKRISVSMLKSKLTPQQSLSLGFHELKMN